MSKADRTKEFIIQKAAPVFNKKGFAGTSLSDLVEITGLTKGSIYGNFENKEDVAVAVYNYSYGLLSNSISDFLSVESSAEGKLLAFVKYYRINWKKIFDKGGCVIQNASVEADDNMPALKKEVQNSIKSWAESLITIIKLGKKRGEFKKDCDPNLYSFTIISILEGGIMLGKIMNSQSFLYTALDRIEKIIQEEIKI